MGTLFTSTNPVTYTVLSAKLKQMGQYTFTLSAAAQADYTVAALNYTSEFRMAGKWLKLFGIDPAKNNVDATDMYISCTNAVATPSLTLQVHGYDNINIFLPLLRVCMLPTVVSIRIMSPVPTFSGPFRL